MHGDGDVVWCVLYYLQGVGVNAELLPIEHGCEVLQTAINAIQIVHQLYPEERNNEQCLQ